MASGQGTDGNGRIVYPIDDEYMLDYLLDTFPGIESTNTRGQIKVRVPTNLVLVVESHIGLYRASRRMERKVVDGIKYVHMPK